MVNNKKNNDARNALRVVSRSDGFNFHTSPECYIGVTSCSLEELANNIKEVCCDAIQYHFERGDFQKWIRETIGDCELAESINDIKTCSRQMSVECCRQEIAEIIRIRILQLESNLMLLS